MMACSGINKSMISELDGVSHYISNSLNTSANITESIQSDISRIVMALQYEDVSSQLNIYVKTWLKYLVMASNRPNHYCRKVK